VIWVYFLVFLVGVATEYLWIEAVDAVHRNNIPKVAFTAVAIPGINALVIDYYVDDEWAIIPMLVGHLVGAVWMMLRKVSRESKTGGPTTTQGHRSCDPS
jgi:hypothetical protein